MTKQEFSKHLSQGRIFMNERDRLVTVVLNNPNLTCHLLDLVLAEDKTEYWHCSWVFDNVMRKNLILLLPCLDTFSNNLKSLTSESVLRPMAHICELLTLGYFKHKNPELRAHLTNNHLEKITESCFDWLIGNHKVATKVFAMTSLFYLGEKYDWIRPELKSVLEQQIHDGSAGFKSRGSKTLEKLKKLGY
ncbi:hypothetical protein GCM10011414_16350 [Croceivirga lutea]|uniref:adenylosuccinate lyase n=1 Tax=Croceivirga lutea TaxID=1775167 RepID=UPI00163B5CF3|nr:adenylosuccinate lyase [Croceivirga lutea]GGG47385.1 hypothetical protein GCM10011414_16350 [Croceivirga lutea]